MTAIKRFLTLSILMLFASASTLPAAEIAKEGTRTRKLQRSVLNVALSPGEIGHHIVESQPHDTAMPTWAAGLLKGMVYTCTRVIVGAYELVTFPIPVPANYAPVMQPEFVWDYFPAKNEEMTAGGKTSK